METSEMLTALDRMCHADGMTLIQFRQVGIWMAAVGPELDMTKLGEAAVKKLKYTHRSLTRKKGRKGHV